MNLKNMKSKALYIVAVLSLCLPLSACAGDDTGENGGNGGGNPPIDYPETTTVNPKYNSTALLRNPLNGWVMYTARDAALNYWDKETWVPELNKNVRIIDYASACYLRTSWALLNPADGQYAWEDPNSHTGKLIRGALDRGLPIALRVVVDGRDQGMNTPRFVFDAGAEYYLENANQPNWRTPYPQDPVFRKYYEKFIEALAKEFNDPKKCAFIDAYGLGKWGEGHNVVYEPGNKVTERTEALKEETMQWITKLYARYFTKIPLVINYHRHIGHPVSDGASASPNSERLLGIAIENGYCLRSDAFGMNNASWGYSSWEKNFAAKWAYKLPILMEGGYIVSQHSYWNDDAGYRQGHPEDVRKGEFDSSREACVNMMDFRYGNETYNWFETSYALVQQFIAEGGYRLYPEQVALPTSVNSGSKVKISHRWRNMGWGYFPNNIPQWNYKYKVAFALLDGNGSAKAVYVDKESEPSKWWQNIPVSYDFVTDVKLPAGTYKWAVALVDTQDGNAPAIKLAVNGTLTDEGWLELMNVEVKPE